MEPEGSVKLSQEPYRLTQPYHEPDNSNPLPRISVRPTAVSLLNGLFVSSAPAIIFNTHTCSTPSPIILRVALFREHYKPRSSSLRNCSLHLITNFKHRHQLSIRPNLFFSPVDGGNTFLHTKLHGVTLHKALTTQSQKNYPLDT